MNLIPVAHPKLSSCQASTNTSSVSMILLQHTFVLGAPFIVFNSIVFSSAFAPNVLRFKHFHLKTPHKKDFVSTHLYAEIDDAGNLDIKQVLESLPSPGAVMENVMEGKFGERGEQYVIAQFSLLLFIAIGTVPFVGAAITNFLGPLLILSGLYAVYRSAADLQNNLSPWPLPADPDSGRGSLVKSGIYKYVRHPMYAGLLFGMTGLSIATDSVLRILLTFALYFVLDVKSNYEEEKLGEVYGDEYENYKGDVRGKFFPADLRKVIE